MHAVFIPYGIKEWVDYLAAELQHCNFELPMRNETTGENKKAWLKGHLRIGPFGVWEYVFPKEYKDKVLTTLGFDNENPYNLGKVRLRMLRKALKCEKIPEFSKDEKLLLIKNHVSIIPVGVRYDKDIVGQGVQDAGFIHEAI